MTKFPAHTINHCRALRTDCTPQEKILWAKLRAKQLGITFRRQHPVGHYILDFYCPQKRLAIEIDGSQHLDHIAYDTARTAYLAGQGITVMRFGNDDINSNIEGVLIAIQEALSSPPQPSPS